MTLWLSPRGHLHLSPAPEALDLDESQLLKLTPAFEASSGQGLLALGAGEAGSHLPPVLAYWRGVASRYFTELCTRVGEDGALPDVPPPSGELLQSMVLDAPPMPGLEYLSMEVLAALWNELDAAFHEAWEKSGLTVQAFLGTLNTAWHLVGRVHFNLAENRKDEHFPFAFLATYTTGLSAHGKAQHLPLGQALKEYAGQSDKLLSLLLPVQRACEKLDWLKKMVDKGEIFHPLRWSPGDAFRFLGDAPSLEQAGVVIRMPAQWKTGRPARAVASASVGAAQPSGFGAKAMLDFQLSIALDGEDLSPEEIKAILSATHGLAFIRGQWVEVDPEKLKRTLERFHEAERLAKTEGLPFAEAMRLLSGTDLAGKASEEESSWSEVKAGPWLKEVLAGLRSPEGLASVDPGPGLKATLRPYQQVGVNWLNLLTRLGLGACLADDMGLGKTLQVLALLLSRHGQTPPEKKRGRKKAETTDAERCRPLPSLLVAPASLLANWHAELQRFTPDLSAMILHPSAMGATALKSAPPELDSCHLAITSYGSLLRMPWLLAREWDLAILDEAQAIKNPGAKQTRAVKGLRAASRIAMTGTPIENRMGDLWSLFDFINPGLLGTAKEFTLYTKALQNAPSASYAPLRNLVRPYILRRLKTDKTVIADLPDKTELKAYCPLSRKQAALYQQAAEEMKEQLEATDGIQRKGLVLAFLMRFKQICNHPSQWLGDNAWNEDGSGKFVRLREICEVIAEKQEKVLVFTQFKENTAPLAAFLAKIFGREGLVLHGETDVKKRKDLVKRFQEDETVPFFVLSIKAGGSGLNLTAASHVIHFDRWWNPSVENQATDRAFRIGQTRNVLVHKFICQGTVEDKIDALIESKRSLSEELVGGSGEIALANLSDQELLRLVSLDLKSALEE